MSDTATRLAAYKAAELQILQAQQVGNGDRSLRLAELQEVRTAIKDLEIKLANEQRGACGGAPQQILIADFSRGFESRSDRE